LKNGLPKIIKGNNKNFIGWEFNKLFLEDKLLRLELIPDGEMGFVYGKQWRDFDGVDQLKKVIDTLKKNPDDRRMIVSAWHPYWVDHCALPPCHVMFHFNTEELTRDERVDLLYQRFGLSSKNQSGIGEFLNKEIEVQNIPKRRLNCLLYQRSVDHFLGGPFNLSSYSLLTCMIAHCVNMHPGTFVHSMGDLHIYDNHVEQVKLQMTRNTHPAPKLVLNPAKKDLFDFQYEDITLENYAHEAAIKGEVAV
jgi:thymidylate synthase